MVAQVVGMKGSEDGVLFQNAEGNINMGVWFDDPDIELDDIFWYNHLAREIEYSLLRGEGLVTVDKKTKTRSCYVELHRKGDFISAVTVVTKVMRVIPTKGISDVKNA